MVDQTCVFTCQIYGDHDIEKLDNGLFGTSLNAKFTFNA